MRFLAPLLVLLAACGPATEPTEAPPDEIDIDTSRRGLIDCSEYADVGYVDGTPFTITLVTVDGKPVERDTGNAYWVMQQAAAADGVQIAVVSGFRTLEEQQYLYDCYVNCSCNNCNLAARPGYSNHQSGHALDLNTSSAGVLDWLDSNGAAFGFSRTVPSEDWHWEWWGGGPGGGPCQGCNASCDGTVMTAPDCSTQDCALSDGTCVDDTFGVRCEPTCAALPLEGGVIDETGSCFSAFGPSMFWRSVEGSGYDGGLLWTNAFENDAPSNWARWQIELTEAGDYDLEVYLDPAWALYSDARYEVRHDGGTTILSLDQSASSGWVSLGTFTLSSGASLSVFDNAPIQVEPDQHIAVDAIRLVRVGDTGPVKPDRPSVVDPAVRELLQLGAQPDEARISIPAEAPPEDAEDPVQAEEAGCSCSTASSDAHHPAAILLLLLGLLARGKGRPTWESRRSTTSSRASPRTPLRRRRARGSREEGTPPTASTSRFHWRG